MKCNLIIELPERSRSICASGGGRALLNIQWHVQVCVLCIGWIQTFRTSILTKYRESWIHIRDLKKIWKMMITLFFIAMFYYFSTIEGKKNILTFVRYWGKFRNVNVKDSSRNSVLWFWRRISEGRKNKVDDNNQTVVANIRSMSWDIINTLNIHHFIVHVYLMLRQQIWYLS